MALGGQTNFNGGELSPDMYGRSDLDQWKKSVESATNCYMMAQGPAVRRNGTQYIATTKTLGDEVRLGKAQFAIDDAFILEFGNLYVRFYKNGAVVGAPYELATPYSDTEVQDITWARRGSRIYIAHPDHEPRVLQKISDTVWTIDPLGARPSPTIENGMWPTTTLSFAAITGTSVVVTAGAAIFLNSDIGRQIIVYDPTTGAKVGRAAITTVALGAVTTTATVRILEDLPGPGPTYLAASGDWQVDLSPIDTITPTSGDTRVGVITTMNVPADTFRATGVYTDVGRYIRLHNGIYKILSVDTTKQLTVEIVKSLDDDAATDAWTLEEEDWSAARGYPRAVGIFEDRLVFGGSASRPNTLWFSEIGIFDGFGRGTADEEGLVVSIKENEIQWLMGGIDLMVGTSGDEHKVSASDLGDVITPTDIQRIKQSSFGSDRQQALGILNETVYIPACDCRINTLLPSRNTTVDVGSYDTEDLLFFSNHMAAKDEPVGIKRLAYAEEPHRLIYAVLNSGDMLVGTFMREQSVLGWTRYTTNGSYEDVACISNNSKDEVWVSVKRTINGVAYRYIEKFDVSDGTDVIDGFSDSYLTYSDPKTITGITQANPAVVTTSAAHGYVAGDKVKIRFVVGMSELNERVFTVANETSTTFELSGEDSTSHGAYTSGGEAHKMVTTISGLSHLEGETVQVKADGATHPDKTVTSGAITLDRSAAEVTVGLSYTTTLGLLEREFSLGAGTMQGQRKRWVRPILRLYKSTIPLVNGNMLPAREPADPMDEAVPLFTGDIEYVYTSDWGSDSTLVITVSDPLPMKLNAIYGTVEGGEK